MMKKTIIIAITMILGLGLTAFAGLLSGEWNTALSYDPSVASFGLSSTFTVDYTVGAWVFSTSSGFSNTGYDSLSFSIEGSLGAFELSGAVNFDPMFVTAREYTYVGFAVSELLATWTSLTIDTATVFLFDDATLVGDVSIRGVDFGLILYIDAVGRPVISDNYFYIANPAGEVATQSGFCRIADTTTTGYGTRLKISSSIGDATITGYAYFNLSEADSTLTSGCLTIGKKGTYSIASAECGGGLNELYVMIEGLTFGYANIGMAAKLTCTTAGLEFDYFRAVATNVLDFLSWVNLSFGIQVATTAIDFTLCGSLTMLEGSCFTINAGLSTADTATPGLGPAGIGMGYEFNGITVSFDHSLNSTEHPIGFTLYGGDEYHIMIPATCTTGQSIDDELEGYYTPVDVRQYTATSGTKFAIAATGGENSWDLTMTTYLGSTIEELVGYAWAYIYAPNAGNTVEADWYQWQWTRTATYTEAEIKTAAAFTYVVTGHAAEYEALLTAGVYGSPFSSDAPTGFWRATSLEFSVPVIANCDLTFGLGISLFGWQSFDVGVDITWQ